MPNPSNSSPNAPNATSHSNSSPTVFGKTMKIVGEVSSDEELQLDGELEGKLTLKGKLTIGPASKVNANIKANTNLRIALRVQDAADSTDVISHLKREAELSELVLRALVLALDRIPTEDELRKRSSSAEEAMREGEELRGEGGFDGGRRPRSNDRRGPPGPMGPGDGGDREREREPEAG